MSAVLDTITAPSVVRTLASRRRIAAAWMAPLWIEGKQAALVQVRVLAQVTRGVNESVLLDVAAD